MLKYEFNQHPGEKTGFSLPVDIEIIKNDFLIICQYLRDNSADSGYKGGVKTTSYRHEIGNVTLNMWHGDAEFSYALAVNDSLVAKFYDCYGKGFFEYTNKKTIDKLLAMAEVHSTPFE